MRGEGERELRTVPVRQWRILSPWIRACMACEWFGTLQLCVDALVTNGVREGRILPCVVLKDKPMRIWT